MRGKVAGGWDYGTLVYQRPRRKMHDLEESGGKQKAAAPKPGPPLNTGACTQKNLLVVRFLFAFGRGFAVGLDGLQSLQVLRV